MVKMIFEMIPELKYNLKVYLYLYTLEKLVEQSLQHGYHLKDFLFKYNILMFRNTW